jgi:hypothetical protein
MTCIKCERKATRRGLCHTHYENRRRKEVAYGRWQSTMIDAEPARQHVKALMAAGMGSRRISELSGVQRGTMQWLTIGRSERGHGPAKRIRDTNAAAILAIPIPDIPHHHVADGTRIPALGTTRRLQALVTIGYTQTFLSERIGWTPQNTTRLFTGSADYIIAKTARLVDDMFRELQLTPGPSQRARNHARQRSWAPPMAWDEDTIDSPLATPQLGQHEKTDFVELYQEMRDLGLGHDQIAARMGVKFQSLLRQVERYELPVPRELATLAMKERYAS